MRTCRLFHSIVMVTHLLQCSHDTAANGELHCHLQMSSASVNLHGSAWESWFEIAASATEINIIDGCGILTWMSLASLAYDRSLCISLFPSFSLLVFRDFILKGRIDDAKSIVSFCTPDDESSQYMHYHLISLLNDEVSFILLSSR
ncbi:hypothetical protein OPV22_027244 [Ensete ventricosum]|uniref:Uncharacterized protein n=1 Tax=Ensete ventricosum TaxID=4639 RepID=A0AAV8PV48_ENSVE|nr:hypothetical protein OPV22_027244 [Ensete ventricosum]